MPQLSKKDLLNLGGSLHDGVHPSQIDDSEWAELINFYQFGPKLRRRRPWRRVDTDSSLQSENLTSIHAFKDAAGVWQVRLGSLTGISKLDSGSIVPLTVSSGGPIPSSTFPWQAIQYNDVSYFMRELAGIKRVTDVIQSAGIPAPTAGATIADGGAGLLPAGAFILVYTFVNLDTDAESNPSPVSNTLTLGANKKISVTGLQTSSTGQVNARRLYLTLPDQSGRYFLVKELADNFSTTSEVNLAIVDFGEFASLDNGLPPAGIKFGVLWDERLICSDGKDVFFSEQGLPESFAEDSIIRVFPDDGHVIRAVHAFGERCIVAKTNKVHFLTRGGSLLFELSTLDDDHGCDAFFSMKSAEGTLFWYGDRQVFRSDGTGVLGISDTKVRRVLDSIDESVQDRIAGGIYPPLSWYLLSIPTNRFGADDHRNDTILVYNYRQNVWTKFQAGVLAPSFIGDFFDLNYDPKLYATIFDVHLYDIHSDSSGEDGDDVFGPITTKARTKLFNFDIPAFYKALRRVYLLASTVPHDITIRVYRDGDITTPVTSRTVTLDTTKEWKKYNLGTLGKLGANLQLEIEYSGAKSIDIAAIAMEIVQHFRSGRAI
jgi:hypothetical protein